MLFVLILILCPTLMTFAQDSTAAGGPPFGVKFDVATLVACLYAIYEIVVRFYPTVGNYSIISWVLKLLAFVFPNRKAKGGTHE